MGSGIFVIQESGHLIEMSEAPYASEDVFQELLELYPNLIAGNQVNSASPRRWLLIQREMSIPDAENSIGRWSVDHLFLDQDAVPTLIEVKRSSDTRIRREVVGQMLDYAANAMSYWSIEYIQNCYEATCDRQGVNPEQQLLDFLVADVEGTDAYWQRVQTNLKAGRVRMIFVSDKIPTELQRIVEFLNEQMSPAEVLAIEIKQYAGLGLKTLVPKIIGQTVEAQRAKHPTTYAEKRQWNESLFLEALLASNGTGAASVIQQVLEWAKQRQLEIVWGQGAKWGSFMLFVVCDGSRYRLIRAWSENSLEIYFKFIRQHPAFEEPDKFGVLLQKLYSIDGVKPTKEEQRETFAKVEYSALHESSLQSFLLFYDWVIEQMIDR